MSALEALVGRAPFSMVLVAAGMLVVLPVLAASVRAVRRGQYERHRRLQLFLAAFLGTAVLVFEIDVRLRGWRHLATPSPYYHTWLFPILYLHLTLAVTTTALWIAATWHGVKRMGHPARPGPHSRRHRLLGRATGLFTAATATTGWIFYWAAFLAN